MQMDSSISHSKLEEWNKAAEGTFWDLLGCTIEKITESEVTAVLEIEPRHLNLIGILHGGVHATLIDSAMGLMAMIAKPEANVVTTNLNIQYVTKVESGLVSVTAQIIHISRKSVTAQAFVRNESGELCAFGTGNFRVV